MNDFLEQVTKERRADVLEARLRVPDVQIRSLAAASARPAHLFYHALLRHRGSLAVIAEVKRRSPALGALATDLDPAAQARRYVAAGASAVSVLTEPRYWGGSLQDLAAVRAAVDVPVLAKDVIVDRYQLYEARAAGADAVLLIAEALGFELTQGLDGAAAPARVHASYLGGIPDKIQGEHDLLREMVALAEGLGMTALVEAHEVSAFARAVACGARVVGVNARNLRRPSEIDVGRVRQLHTFVHADQILVAESGIGSVDDARLLPARVDAVLVGTALIRADDPAPLIHGIASIRRGVGV